MVVFSRPRVAQVWTSDAGKERVSHQGFLLVAFCCVFAKNDEAIDPAIAYVISAVKFAIQIDTMTAKPLVTTYLEMRSPDQLRPKRADEEFHVREQPERDWRFNRDLYFLVGEQWEWVDKRQWTDDRWKEYATAPELRTFAGYYGDVLAGYYELRRDRQAEIEIAYFGLLPEWIGRGLGGALLTSAIEAAWRMDPQPSRVWVHTCNRDHPQALANYQARGMVVYKVEEEP